MLNYDEPVAKYWPEFGKHGKEKITVAQLMRHEAGLARFSKPIDVEWLTTENIKKNMMGKIIEDETPRKLPHGMTRAYHAFNKDLILNEIFRRVEPQGRTMGEYFHQEIKDKYKLQINIVNSPEDNAIT